MTTSDHQTPEQDPELPTPEVGPSGKQTGWLARRAAEGGVIVASILMAFAVDAWWEDRQERELEDQVLATIRQDMEANEALLSGLVLQAEQRVDLFATFISADSSELAEMDEDSAAFLVQTLFIETTFQPVYGSLSDANLTLVRDVDLRNELSAWLGALEDLTETAPYQIEGSFELMDLAGETGALFTAGPLLGVDVPGPTLNEALVRMRRDETFSHTALRVLLISGIAARKLAELHAATERVLGRLEATGS